MKVLESIILIVVLLVLSVTLWEVFLKDDSTYTDAEVVDSSQIEIQPSPESLSSRLLFGGDVFWGRLFERRAPADYSFPFSGLSTMNKSKYDTWIANVECPVTDENVAFDLQWEAIQFNCRPEYLPELAKWFEIVSLANNHTDNVRLQEGLSETRRNLEKNKIQHFGNYEPAVLEDLCEVVTVGAKLNMDDGKSTNTSFPIVLCGYHGVYRTFTEQELAHIQKYSKHFITISMPHAGEEYKPNSDVIRETAYRKMIDYGADAVFGNQPHWAQNTEAYKGKLIAYSMGNLIFDQEFNNEVTRSYMIDMKISMDHSDNIQKYVDIADKCKTYKDKCLRIAKDNNLTKPKIDIEYDLIATRTTNLVTKLDKQGLASILERADWKNTQNELKKYSAVSN